MSKFRRTEDFDLDYIDEYKEEIRLQNLRDRERKERIKLKDKQRLEYIKAWDDLNG